MPLVHHGAVNQDRRELAGVRLSPQEWRLFELLASQGGHLVTQERLRGALYSGRRDGGPRDKSLTVLVCALRKKCPFRIENVHSTGYILHGYVMLQTTPSTPAMARLMAGR